MEEFRKRWAEFDENSLRRARERQEWANNAERRHQERRREFQETMRKRREAFLEAQRREKEESEMIAKMLDALCQLGETERRSSEVKGKGTKESHVSEDQDNCISGLRDDSCEVRKQIEETEP